MPKTSQGEQRTRPSSPPKGKAVNGIRSVGRNRWEVRINAGKDPVTGKPIQRSRTVTGTKGDAKLAKAALVTEMTTSAADSEAEGKTFGNLLDRWLDFGRHVKDRSPNTIQGYEKKIAYWIRPALGNYPLNAITTRTLDDWYRSMRDEGVSPATVMACHRIIAAALHQAEKWEDIVVSPARKVSPPSVPKKEFAQPSPAQVRALVVAAEESPRMLQYGEMILLASLTGMRRGELCALQWGDIDWERSTLTVRHALWEAEADPENGVRRHAGVKGPKAHQVRTLDLDEIGVALLHRRLERLKVDGAVIGVKAGQADGFVFAPDPVTDPTTPMLPSLVTQAFRRLCRKLEKRTGESWPFRFHDLRHFNGSQLLAAGVPVPTVAKRLGHANSHTTLTIYAHDVEGQGKVAAAAMQGVLGLDPKAITA